ncbi:hypothetical protein XU18_3855 [Perkinsela sp. CCAP 1560/4]|nr:hypothetical protein XU18_3855 [Perkinsela sp. CCAP 1560/4]|eukprot:KNH04981.1 hypothetical protein XU18_3855 [Perkinsela sp. CCAP 1560/4]
MFLHFCNVACLDDTRSASEVTYRPLPHTDGWQTLLMEMFFRDISLEVLVTFSQDFAETHYCIDWKGITCLEGVVTSLKYNWVNVGNFYINAVPPDVKDLSISTSNQEYSIETHSWGRSLSFVDLSINNLYGTVDLTALPRHLRVLYLYQNKLRGPLDLTNLPTTLHILSLESIEITQPVIFYANLPPSIKNISLRWPPTTIWGTTPKICASNPLHTTKHKDIFLNIPERYIT